MKPLKQQQIYLWLGMARPFRARVTSETMGGAMDSFIGTILNFGFNFAPSGWSTCQGQMLSVNQNAAVFSLLGTVYGGDGQTTFGLPDLRGRVAIGQGQLSGGGNYVIGQLAGSENATLNAGNLPPHTHSLTGSSAQGTTGNPSGAVLANANYTDGDGNSVAVQVYAPAGSPTPLAQASIGSTGSGAGFSILSPYLTINPCICLQGIYPSRQ